MNTSGTMLKNQENKKKKSTKDIKKSSGKHGHIIEED